MSSRNWIITVGILIVIVLAGVYFVNKSAQTNQSPSPTPDLSTQTSPTESPSVSPSDTASPSASMSQTVVKVTADGFSPRTVTIKAGDSVTWENTDTAPHQVNSNPHPTHTDYPPLNTVGLIEPGQSKSLTFPTPGTYKYHDHLNPQNQGEVIVQ